MLERGTSREEVTAALSRGEKVPAKKSRHAYRLNFQFNQFWGGKHYRIKQVVPIVKEEEKEIVVITVYVFYF